MNTDKHGQTRTGKARLLVLDLETYRTRNPVLVERIRQEALDKRPAQNCLKELKTLWDTAGAREERAQEALGRTAVDVLLAEVLCCCWRADGAPYSVQGMYGPTGDKRGPEPVALELLAEQFEEQAGPETIWIGHNLGGFDLAVLLNRWRRHGIRPPAHFPKYTDDRWRGRIFDTMRRVPCKNGIGFVSLHDVCSAYGLRLPKETVWQGAPMDGSRVGVAYEAGEYDLILEYCDEDVVITEQLYQHITGGDTYSTYDKPDTIAAEIAEIENSDLPENTKKLSIYTVLDRAGLIPRVA